PCSTTSAWAVRVWSRYSGQPDGRKPLLTSACVDQPRESGLPKALQDVVDEDPRLRRQHLSTRVVKRNRARIAVPTREQPHQLTALDRCEGKGHWQQRNAKPQPRGLRHRLGVAEDEPWLARHELLAHAARSQGPGAHATSGR